MAASLDPIRYKQLREDVVKFLTTVVGAIRIPARTEARQCKKCPAMIYDVPGVTPGKMRVVSIAKYKEHYPDGIAPTDTEDGAGVSHFSDCPAASEFRNQKKRRV